jgi:hypothetical protein
MTVLILGPYGAGKSTLVRRLMKPREWEVVYRSGPLPWSYHSKDLVVYGNYERTSRTRHGMSVFDRDPLAFDLTIRYATESKLPGLMEGGFSKAERIWMGYGPMFAKTCRIVYLDVVGEPKDRLGRKLTEAGIEDYEFRIMKATAALKKLGASLDMIEDRQQALERVCELLGLKIPTEEIEEDYR